MAAQVGEYSVTTGAGTTPEQVSALVWPGNDRVVYLGCERWGDTVTYWFLVDCTPPDFT